MLLGSDFKGTCRKRVCEREWKEAGNEEKRESLCGVPFRTQAMQPEKLRRNCLLETSKYIREQNNS